MKNWKGITEKKIYMGTFDFNIIVVVGDYKTACAYVSWKFEDKDNDLKKFDVGYIPRGECFFRQGYAPVIWIPKKPKTAREHATLAHESLHAVFHLFEWADLPLTRDTEEVMTHAMSYIITNAI